MVEDHQVSVRIRGMMLFAPRCSGSAPIFVRKRQFKAGCQVPRSSTRRLCPRQDFKKPTTASRRRGLPRAVRLTIMLHVRYRLPHGSLVQSLTVCHCHMATPTIYVIPMPEADHRPLPTTGPAEDALSANHQPQHRFVRALLLALPLQIATVVRPTAFVTKFQHNADLRLPKL